MAAIVLIKDYTKSNGNVVPAGKVINVHMDHAKELIAAGIGKVYYEKIEPKTFKVSVDEEE